VAARSGLRDPSWHQPFPTVTGSGETLRTVWTVLWTKTCSADGVDNVDASVDIAKVRVAGSNPVVRSEKDRSQALRRVCRRLGGRQIQLTIELLRVHRPW